MYLQITTKCNMKCEHCCYSCSMKGKHADFSTAVDMIAFARDTFGDETITIGGGEPTLHPRFFDILKICLEDFDFVWMATNGSQTAKMHRLSNIIDGNDFPECTCEEDDPEQFEDYGCLCHEKMDLGTIYQENKLTVALSLDPFHDPINEQIENIWTKRSKRTGYNHHSHYEIRDVTQSRDGAISEGRAKKTGAGWAEGCVCSDLLIKPDGKIKLCGCKKSPVIGDIQSGINEKWEKIIYENENFNDERCFKALH